jgi:hypothetical protein
LANSSGARGDQSVSGLALQDQSGTQDDWYSYIEFQTPGKVYIGTQTFKLPSNIAGSAVTGLKINLNYRGPLKSAQTWTWQIYNWSAASWVTLGTNILAKDWVWTNLSFNIPAPYTRFINSQKQIRIQLKSNNASDNALLDYESIAVTYNAASAPTPTPTASPNPTPVSGDYWKPGLVTSWQIQYSGTINTSLDVNVYNLDGEGTTAETVSALHARGIKVMCYFSAGSWENYRNDKNSFPASVLGKVLDGWPDERWLDIRQISILKPIMEARMDMCKSKGFDGIDPDNIDGYTNDTGFPLTYNHQLAYNIMLANAGYPLG